MKQQLRSFLQPFAFLIFSLFLPFSLASEEAPAPAPEEPSASEGGLLTVDFENRSIREILRNVAVLAGLNVVIPDSIEGQASLSIRDVTWQRIFDLVLEETGFTWREEDGVIRFQRLGPEEAVTINEAGGVSVHFRNEPLRDALQVLADRIDRNIVIPPDLTGTTSSRLTNVTWQQVMDGILLEHDFTWFEDDDIIRLRLVDSRVQVDPETGLLSIRVDNLPFQEVLGLVGRSQVPPINIISPPELENLPLSLRVEAVSFEDALDLLLSKLPREARVDPADTTTPIQYQTRRQSANLIRIIDSASLDRDPPVVRIFPLRYAEVGQVTDNLRSDNGFIVRGIQNIHADSTNNLLIVTGTVNAFPELTELIESLDQPARQISIESRFVEVSDVDERQLGINWASLRNFEVGAGPFERQWERERTTTRSVEDEMSFTRSRERSFSTGDGASMTLPGGTLSSEGGIGFASGTLRDNLTGDTLLDGTTTFDSRVRTFDNIDSTERTRSDLLESVGRTSRIDSAVFSADRFRLVLSALAEDTDARLTSNPTILTLNGQEAQISIEERRFRSGPPVVGERGIAQPGAPVPLEVQPKTALSVTPTVIGGDLISMKIRPEINNIIEREAIPSGESVFLVPVVRQRTTESTVLLRSGYTLAIGGLMDEDRFQFETKVPVLGDLPLLGRFFRHEQTQNRMRNQIIFVTARILNAQTDTYEDVVGLERLNQMGLTSRDVQGVGARHISDEEEALQRAILRAREEARSREEMETIRRQMEALGMGEDEDGDRSRPDATSPPVRRTRSR